MQHSSFIEASINRSVIMSKKDNDIFTDILIIQPDGRDLCEVKQTTKSIQVIKVLKIPLHHNYKS